MMGRRAIPMLLAVALLLLTGGECVTPLFADQQSKERCARGMCQRSGRQSQKQSQKKDPCCQVAPPAITKYFQRAGKVTFDQALPVVDELVGGAVEPVPQSLN